MMRIAYVCTDPGVPIFGRKGGSIHVREVVRALLARGAEVQIIARRLGGEPPADLAHVPVHRIGSLRGSTGVERERLLIESNDKVRELLGSMPDIDMVYERHALFAHAGMEHARDRGLPGLLEVNAPLVEEQKKFRSLTLVDEAERSAAQAFGAASAILAVSEALGDRLRGESGVNGDVVRVVPNGVDVSRFGSHGARANEARKGVVTIGFVGSLRRWHDVLSLVEAFDLVRAERAGVRLVIVGDGPQREAIEEQVAVRGLRDSVELVGAVDGDEIPGWLSSMDIAVAPYPVMSDFYFSPLKLFEYMASGRAIVACASGQIAQIILDGSTGLLYEPGNTASLAAALGRLVDDRHLRDRIGAEARRIAIRDHQWASVADQILGLGDTPLVARGEGS